MTNIISDILEIEDKADAIINKSIELAKDLENDTESKLRQLSAEAEKRINAAKEDEIKKRDELIKTESERIEKETEIKKEKMMGYYAENKERIISRLFDKALKA